jgi:hypothetical protein
MAKGGELVVAICSMLIPVRIVRSFKLHECKKLALVSTEEIIRKQSPAESIRSMPCVCTWSVAITARLGEH